MSEHLTEWLGAYLDGELSGDLLHWVETHLVECQTCYQEYRSMQRLSGILQEAPLPDLVPTARFASQVALRLPSQPVKSKWNKVLEAGWWMIPVGLMTLWIFVHIAFTLNDWLSTASSLGFISPAGWVLSASPVAARLTTTLGEFGLLDGSNLEWAAWSESLTRTIFSQMSWQFSIAMLYLSWMVIWLATPKTREEWPTLRSQKPARGQITNDWLRSNNGSH